MAWDREKERRAGKAMTISGCIYGIVFIIVWCGIAVSMGAYVMLLFGIPFLGIMIYRTVVVLQLMKEDKQKQQQTQLDPWDRPAARQADTTAVGGFCPYCGMEVRSDYEFCPKCGRRLR